MFSVFNKFFISCRNISYLTVYKDFVSHMNAVNRKDIDTICRAFFCSLPPPFLNLILFSDFLHGFPIIIISLASKSARRSGEIAFGVENLIPFFVFLSLCSLTVLIHNKIKMCFHITCPIFILHAYTTYTLYSVKHRRESRLECRLVKGAEIGRDDKVKNNDANKSFLAYFSYRSTEKRTVSSISSGVSLMCVIWLLSNFQNFLSM